MLTLSNIAKSFGGSRVLDDLSLSIEDGEIFALLGPSGCGKTTLLRILAGLESADAGRVTFNEQVWQDAGTARLIPTKDRNIGLVFQSYAIWPHLKVVDQIAYPLRNRRMDRSEIVDRVMAMLDVVGLSGLGDRQASQLSGGQQQRVAMARALVAEPNILLLDEPFSNLDVALRAQLRLEIRAIQRRLGVTIILVTHDQQDAFSLSDRIAVLNRGRIEQIGTGSELYAAPTKPFVAGFVGRSAVLDGVHQLDSSGRSFAVLDDGAELPVSLNANAPAGAALRFWVRPEHLKVVEGSRTDGQRSSLAGRIQEYVFAGDRLECFVDVGGGRSLVTYSTAATLPIGTDVHVVFDQTPTAFTG